MEPLPLMEEAGSNKLMSQYNKSPFSRNCRSQRLLSVNYEQMLQQAPAIKTKNEEKDDFQ